MKENELIGANGKIMAIWAEMQKGGMLDSGRGRLVMVMGMGVGRGRGWEEGEGLRGTGRAWCSIVCSSKKYP